MKSRAIGPVLVVVAVAATGLWLQGATPSVPTGQWQTGAALGQPRTGAVPVMLDDGRVLLIGGRAAGAPVAAVDVVNPDGSITAGIPLSLPRAGHTAVRLADGSVLVAGGTTLVAGDQGTVEAATATAEVLYAGATQWIAATGLTQARTGATATSLPDGRVLVAGGADDNGPLDTFEIYDPISTTFHPGGLLSAARAGHAAAVAGKTSVLVAGGHNASGAIGTADIIDPDTGGVVTVTMTAARDGASATALVDGRVLVAGGWDGTNDLLTAEVIDPASATTTATLPMGSPRRNPQALLLDHNATVLITGGTNAGAVVPTAEHFVAWENGFRPAANNPAVSRTGALTSALPAEGVALLAAGQGTDSSLVAPTELYGFATLHTDKDDYPPGTFVTITGSGWQPGETVNMVLHETGPNADPDLPLNALADANGNFTNDAWAPNEGDLGRRFYLTAIGAGATAQTTFTDARQFSLNILGTGTGSVTLDTTTGANPDTFKVAAACGGTNANISSWTFTSSCTGSSLSLNNNNATGTLTATANTGSFFSGWSLASNISGCTSTTSPCSFSVTGSGPAITATFNLNATTSTTVTSSSPSSTSTYGESVTFTALVKVGATAVTTGSVTFIEGGTCASPTTTLAGPTVVDGSGQAAFSTSALTVPSHVITACYGGAVGFNSSNGSVTQTVNKANTTTSITTDAPEPSVVGQPVTISYTVTSTGGTPTGNVTVSDGTQSCTATVAAGSCSITFTSPGAKSLTATYAGATNFNGSTSASEPHTVNKANTTTTITAHTPDPSVVGQPVAVAYSVTVNSPGSGSPTGSVTVTDGTQSCTGTIAAGTCSITFTTAGAKSLTATYVGDTNFNTSTSTPSTSHTVNKANTTTTITSDTPDPSVVGQPVAVGYTVTVNSPGAGTPTADVTVSDGTDSCTASVAAGTCNITFTTAGAKSLTATYAGDTNFNGSASTPVTPHQVNKADTTTAITSDTPDPSVVGQPVTVAYSVTAVSPGTGTATGNVTVSDGVDSCTASAVAGTCNITFTSAGAKSLTATYAGDANFNGSASMPATPHLVNKADTTTSITSNTPNPSVVGAPVTVNFSVAVTAPGSGTPTGNVTISDGTQSCTGTVAAGTCNLTFTSAGAKSLTASYAGDTNFNGSTSVSESHTVNKANTTTTITADTPDPSVVGQTVPVTFSVTVNAPGSGTPTGNVTVSDGTESCSGTVAAGTCNLTFTSAGTKTLTATYVGDTNFNGSTSAAESHTVNKANTTTTITADTPDPSVVGQPVPVTYSVTVNSPGTGTPTGNVTVSDGTDSCVGTVAAGTCNLTFTSAGTKALTATYAGDTNFNGSTSGTAAHQVDKASTTTTITSDAPDPSVVGQPVAVAYSVSVNSPGSGTPTGNVTVSDGTDSCFASIAAGTCNITFTSAGAKTLTATYAGDSNFNGSTSATAAHQVDKANTTTTITSDSPDPSVVGQSVTIAFSVTVNAPGAGTPTGNVTVSNGALSCTASVAVGNCAIAFSTAGPHPLTATFVGDANFNGSTSASEPHQVDKANTTTTITSDAPDPSVVGQVVTIDFNVTVTAPGAGTPTGNVTVSDGTQSCVGTVAAGSCQIAFSTVGSHPVTATYAGDTNFNGSASASEPHQVDKANTTTTISSDAPDPSVVGQTVTVNFGVTVNAPGTGTPTGNVTVSAGADNCTGTVLAGTCNITFTSAGAKTLTATYAGDTNFNGSTSASESHTVNKANTTTTITADTPDPSVVGQPVPVAYSVTVNSPGTGTPTGNVTVSDGTTSCVGTVAAGTCNLTFTSTGAKTLTATYAGDTNFNGSTSASESHTVNKANTTTTITADTPDPSVVGQPVPVTFSVTVDAPGSGTPAGNVTVSAGADSCIGTVAAGTCNLTFTSAGAKSVTATYAGDGNFNGSTSASEAHQVNKAATTTVITNDAPDPSVLNSPYAVSWSVTVNSPGVGAPTGTVTVSDGSATCSAAVAAGGCSLTSTTPGAKSLLATYSGDGNFNGSSGSAAHNVQYAFTGFFAPVDNAPVVNKANAGQAIPVKWRVTDTNGVGISDPNSFVSLMLYPVACGGWNALPSDPLPDQQVSTSGLLYQGSGNWQYNWKTPKNYANMCMVARVTLFDGSTHDFDVSFK